MWDEVALESNEFFFYVRGWLMYNFKQKAKIKKNGKNNNNNNPG